MVALLRYDTLSLDDGITSRKKPPLSVPEAEAGPRLRAADVVVIAHKR